MRQHTVLFQMIIQTYLDDAAQLGGFDRDGGLLVERFGDFGVPDTLVGADALKDSEDLSAEVAVHLALLQAMAGIEQIKVDAVI